MAPRNSFGQIVDGSRCKKRHCFRRDICGFPSPSLDFRFSGHDVRSITGAGVGASVASPRRRARPLVPRQRGYLRQVGGVELVCFFVFTILIA